MSKEETFADYKCKVQMPDNTTGHQGDCRLVQKLDKKSIVRTNKPTPATHARLECACASESFLSPCTRDVTDREDRLKKTGRWQVMSGTSRIETLKEAMKSEHRKLTLNLNNSETKQRKARQALNTGLVSDEKKVL